ncbi:MAG: DMT family transporter [Pseudomonadota bacterium]
MSGTPTVNAASDAPRNVLGAVLLASSWIFFTTEMVTTRILAENLSIAQIGIFRLGFQAVVLLPVIAFTAGAVLKTSRFPLHFVRAIFSAGGMVLFYLAFALLPLATATTLTFTVAIWLTIFAALFLGETVGIRRKVSVMVGLIGVLVVMRPGLIAIDVGMVAAVAGAIVAALLMITTRSLGATEGRLTIMSYSALLGLVFLAVPAALTWQPIATREEWLLLALVGAAGTTGQFMMVWAFQIGEASALAPVDYVRLVFALIAGYVVFSEIPDIWTWLGAAIIIASTLYTTYRERIIARRQRKERADGTPA